MYRLRPYQQQAADVAVRYFKDRSVTGNGVMVLPTGSGKSLVIADIAARLGAPVLVFQPSKEILEQNYAKLCAYDILECSVYSACAFLSCMLNNSRRSHSGIRHTSANWNLPLAQV